jgi:hypothetical protein
LDNDVHVAAMIDNGGGGKIQASEPLGEGVGVNAVIGNVDNDDDGGGGGDQYVDFLLFCQNPDF